MGAVEANDGVIFDADDIAAAVVQFAATYALYDPASQTSFAAALAILEAAPAAGGFSTLDSSTQQAFLTAWQPNAPASARAAGEPGAPTNPGQLLKLAIGPFTLGPIAIPQLLELQLGGQNPQQRDQAVFDAVGLSIAIVTLGVAIDDVALAALLPDIPEPDATDPALWESPS